MEEDNTGEESSQNTQEQPSQTIYTSTCSQCDHIFSYPAGTPWSRVNQMVNEHWEVCPNSTRAALARLLESQDEDMNETSQVGRSHDGSSTTDSSGTTTTPDETEDRKSVERPKKHGQGKGMNEQQRKQMLESDEWATDVQPTSVKCGACEKVIKLDKRSTYYPGLWNKHRGKCPELKRFEAIKQRIAQRQAPANSRTDEGFTGLGDTFFATLTNTQEGVESSNHEDVENEIERASEHSYSGSCAETTGSEEQDQIVPGDVETTIHVESQDTAGHDEIIEDTDDEEDLYWTPG